MESSHIYQFLENLMHLRTSGSLWFNAVVKIVFFCYLI